MSFIPDKLRLFIIISWIINKKYASARDRTTDLKIFSLTLSQLSYKGKYSFTDKMAYQLYIIA